MVVSKVEAVDVSIVKSYAQDLRSLLKEAEFTEKKSFLRSFIKRIEVDKQRVTIHYNLPLPQNGKSNKQTAVLPIDTLGRPSVTIGRTFKLAFNLSS